MTDKSKQLSFNVDQPKTDNGPVVCLGMTFKNDDERREYFRSELRKKLPELKQIEGFPIGDDEDIIALSDPPYYTACPNPWINDFINEWEKEKVTKYGRKSEDKYHREPFSSDVSEGKGDSIYNAHSYHTKVPHKAIMRYILHYTKPGDIILDGFCGTGMTGVAGQICGNPYVEEDFKVKIDSANDNINWGSRKVINNDLSPIATFISYIYNNPINVEEFEKEAKELLEDCKRELGWMYKTNHKIEDLKYRDSKKEIKGDINYIIWSDVFICPNCGNELIFWDIAVDKKEGKIREVFNCCNCNANLKKNDCERVWESFYDERLDKTVTIAKQVPVLINYSIGNKRFEKRPDNEDFELIRKINNSKIPYWYPTDELPVGYNTEQPRRSHGITHVHLFYTKRNLFVLSYLMEKIRKKGNKALAFLVQSYNLTHSTKMSRIIFKKGNNKPILTSHQSGTLYISSLPVEKNLINGILNTKLNIVVNALSKISEKNIVTTQSMTKIENIPDNSIDYIFTDPPFGANINYSELSFIWEAWLKVFTNNKPEAIINPVQKKDLTDYQNLMTESIKEYYRVLKPGRWITVEFSNTKSSVWNAIQDGLQRAGFVIANVSALDKKQGSFKAVTTTTAVKQDLIISAYKPRQDTIEKIEQTKNTEDSVWTFVTQHLQQLPVFEGQKGEAKLIAERTPRILFDRMVAYFVQKGLPVPMSSGDFQVEVAQRYPMRDGMIFLESQVAEYDKKRTLVKEFTQISLFVSDENSAIEWIRQQLMNKPQTRQDLHPEFMKQIQHIAKHEELPELDDLLEQNFLRYQGDGPVPNQILTYLRRNYKDLRGLEPTDLKVIEKALERWYVPDPNKQSDLEKLREKALLREFNQYKDEIKGNRKKLRTFRTEAIRAGFKNAYKEKDFETIVKVGDRIPEKVIQEDDKLFMYYENAKIRLGL